MSIVSLPCFLKLSDFLALLKTHELLLGERLLTKVDRIFTFNGVDFGIDCLALAILYLLLASVLMSVECYDLSLTLNLSKQKVYRPCRDCKAICANPLIQ